MLKLLGSAAPPQVTGQGQHCELARELQAGSPITQQAELEAELGNSLPEGSQCSQGGCGASFTWSENLGLNCLALLSAGQHNGHPRAITGCSCCSDTSDCHSDTGRQSHRPGSKTGWIFHNSLSPTHHVWDTWVSRGDPEQHPNSQHCMQESAQNAQKCHIPCPQFRLPIQWEKDVKQTRPWSQNMKILSNQWSVKIYKSQTLPDFTVAGCLFLIWIIKR